MQGQTLTEQHGTWANNPTSYSYQWLRCDAAGANCTAIDSAATDQYLPVQDDVGQHSRCRKRHPMPADTAPRRAPPRPHVAARVPQNILPPSITGTPQQGKTLSEQPGRWTNQPTWFAYQWLRCDATARTARRSPGATSQTTRRHRHDVGSTLEVQETASNLKGDSQPALSSATQPIKPAVPVNTSGPTISGTAQQGQTLAEHHGDWTNTPTSYAYQWLRCDSNGVNCSPIDGAISDNYVLVHDDVGQTLEVQETASNAGGTSAPALSAATAVVTAAVPQNTLPPTISGTPQQGKTLAEQHGSWTNQPTSYSYQWMDCNAAGANCAPISGATKNAYVVTESDVGKQLAVQEVATNGAGDGQPAQSDATTTVIPPAPVNTAPPAISGTAHQGDKLTVQQGTWSGATTSYGYQWLRCDSAGANCQSISGATDTSYVPVGADAGNTIEVRETAQGPGGAGDPATSVPTAVVTAAQAPTASLALNRSSGVAPFDLTATIGGVDPEGRAMTYSLDFGDGTTVQTGPLPADPIAHTYQHAGDYVVRLSVDDGTLTDVKTANVVVALSAPLAATPATIRLRPSTRRSTSTEAHRRLRQGSRAITGTSATVRRPMVRPPTTPTPTQAPTPPSSASAPTVKPAATRPRSRSIRSPRRRVWQSRSTTPTETRSPDLIWWSSTAPANATRRLRTQPVSATCKGWPTAAMRYMCGSGDTCRPP